MDQNLFNKNEFIQNIWNKKYFKFNNPINFNFSYSIEELSSYRAKCKL